MIRRVHRIAAAAALALAPVAAVAAGEPAAERATISIAAIRTVPAPGGQPGMVKQFTVTLRPAGGGPARNFVVHGPDKLIDAGEQPRAEILGDRLLVLTEAVIAVFDLGSGEQLLDLAAAPVVAATADGRRAAFETLQHRFTPPEASSSVIQVLDVPSGAVEPVFPERSLIEPAQLGGLLAWIDDPAERHSAGPLIFSPDGSRLAFFCHHGGDLAEGAPKEVYLVVVDLPADLADSRFVHQRFDWKAYLRPRVAADVRDPYFDVESLSWSEDGELTVRTPLSTPWLEPEFTVPVPETEGQAGASKSAGKAGRP